MTGDDHPRVSPATHDFFARGSSDGGANFFLIAVATSAMEARDAQVGLRGEGTRNIDVLDGMAPLLAT